MNNRRNNSKNFILVFAALLSAFGPFMTDLYLPAFPQMKEYFGTTASLIQLSLTFGLIGLAGGQLLIGPLSDRYGRRYPLILSMCVFVLSTLACMLSPNVGAFIFFRLLQGISAAGGVVISRAIAVDLYEGKEFTHFFSLLSAVQGLAPIVAPVIGGLLLEVMDWRGAFMVLLLIGIGIVIASFGFKETLLEKKKSKGKLWTTFVSYKAVMTNRRFLYYLFIQAFVMGVLFAYISSSPFIFQIHFGLSPVVYSCCFACNAVAIMMGNLSVSRFRSGRRALSIGAFCLPIAALAVAGGLSLGASVLYVEILLLALLFCVGMVMPTSISLALDMERENTGNASAMLGFFQFLFGGLAAPLVGIGEIIHTSGLVILIASLITAGLVLCLRRRSGAVTDSAIHLK